MLSEKDIATYFDQIGGSMAPAVLGIDPSRTPYQAWLEFIDPSTREDLSENEDIEAGNELEEAIFRWGVKRTGLSIVGEQFVQYSPAASFHPDYPFMRARPDGLVIRGDGEIVAGIECKNRNLFKRKQYGESTGADDTDAVLPTEAIQCHHNMAVTGIPKWHLFVLTGGNRLKTYVIRRDQSVCDAIIHRCSEFWEMVQSKTPPPPTNVNDCHLMWPKEAPGRAVEASDEVAAMVDRLRNLKASAGDLEVQIDLAAFKVKSFLKDGEILTRGGKQLASWKADKRGVRTLRL
jgi:predicted phage-related endonuclease